MRTRNFYGHGPSGPANWVLTRGKQIPDGALSVAPEANSAVYLARAFHKVSGSQR